VGFAASHEDEWFESLRSLLLDADLRQQMGKAGRALVESKFCIEANIDRLESVLKG
jgi:hypothetical protein